MVALERTALFTGRDDAQIVQIISALATLAISIAALPQSEVTLDGIVVITIGARQIETYAVELVVSHLKTIGIAHDESRQT